MNHFRLAKSSPPSVEVLSAVSHGAAAWGRGDRCGSDGREPSKRPRLRQTGRQEAKPLRAKARSYTGKSYC